MDFLIQRYLPDISNEAHKNSGGWEDIGIERGLKADDHEVAIAQAMASVPALPAHRGGGKPDRLRAIKYEHIEEFDGVPGPLQLAKGEKGLRGDGT
jgi:hypothetical protein